jgi:hypothetical protein
MHPIRIGAPRDMTGGYRPALLQRHDDDFIEATLDDLRTTSGRQTLQGLRAQARTENATNNVLKLFQPIQRQFHLALIEAWCETPGLPRIDPARVVAAGMVLRRIGSNGREGWMRSKGRARGWIPLQRIGGEDADPAAGARLQRSLTGVADIDRKFSAYSLQKTDNLLNEDVIPLYHAPPDVCADAAKTIFYGVIPTTSSEISDVAAELSRPGDSSFGPMSPAFTGHLYGGLAGQGMVFPFPGETVVGGWLEAAEMPGDSRPAGVSQAQFDALTGDSSAAGSDAARMRVFLKMLQQLGSEFNAFASSAEVNELKLALQKIELPLVRRNGETQRRSVNAYAFLASAAAILLAKEQLPNPPEMPESWPAAADNSALANALHKAMTARFAASKGKSGRYDEPDGRYVIRAFVRLKCEHGGSTKIVWSEESEPFVIAPWYEGAGAPPVQIPLPDASDKNLLRSLKPNVAFIVPPAMQNLLTGKAKDLMAGTGSLGSLGLSWICSFNIPVITICAFIVLNIFLTLFNLIFGWLFFIKICIPFPKLGNKPPPS